MNFKEYLNECPLNEDESTNRLNFVKRNRLNFVKRDFNELIKNEKDEAGLYLNTVNLVCNGIKLLGTFDPKMLSNEYEINTEKYKKLINDLTNKL